MKWMGWKAHLAATLIGMYVGRTIYKVYQAYKETKTWQDEECDCLFCTGGIDMLALLDTTEEELPSALYCILEDAQAAHELEIARMATLN